MISSHAVVIRLLKGGATIQRGTFSGYWIVNEDTRMRVLPRIVHELEDQGLIAQIDDNTSMQGQEWAIKGGS